MALCSGIYFRSTQSHQAPISPWRSKLYTHALSSWSLFTSNEIILSLLVKLCPSIVNETWAHFLLCTLASCWFHSKVSFILTPRLLISDFYTDFAEPSQIYGWGIVCATQDYYLRLLCVEFQSIQGPVSNGLCITLDQPWCIVYFRGKCVVINLGVLGVLSAFAVGELLGRSLLNNLNRRGPCTLACGTPDAMGL